MRAAPAWPPASGQIHTRPWRSSPLAGHAFSRLPPIISESSEDSHENELGKPESARKLPRTRSPSSSSIVSQTGSLSASGYGSRNASGSASALLIEGETSTSSVSSTASAGAQGTPPSQGHGGSSNRPARTLSKSSGRRTLLVRDGLRLPRNASDVSVVSPPRARTVSHGHARPVSFPVHPLAPSPTIPQAYSRTSPRPTSPESETNTAKQPPSKPRDPSSNWMSSSPFGPAQTPKFSRLAMASPAVVMPLSAKEYRKQRARVSVGSPKEKESPTSSKRVVFVDDAPSAHKSSIGVPLVMISPPTSQDVHQPPLSSGDHGPDRRSQPQPRVDHPPPKPLPHASMPPRPSSPKQKRPHSRPNTPPRSSPLAVHPPISPKSSTSTFFSLAGASDDDTPHPQSADVPSSVLSPPVDDPSLANAVPPARPRPRLRRKSYPDRLSSGARLSLLGAMDRLSQESTSLHRLSALSQTDEVNRLSVVSQTSGHTLFYDVESEGEQGQVVGGNGGGNADGGRRKSMQHTKSLEDLSSTLARTGIEVVQPQGGGNLDTPLDDERKGKRNVRMVRISDIVEVSPSPVPRRRKLTKSRPGPTRESTQVFGAGPAFGTGTAKDTKVQPPTQTQQRRASLLPWKSKGSGDGRAGAVSSSEAGVGERGASIPTGGFIHPIETAAATLPRSLSPIANGSTHVESHSTPKSNGQTKKTSFASSSRTPPSPEHDPLPSALPRKSRGYTFSFLPSSTFHRPKRGKSNTIPPGVEPGLDQNTGKPKGLESGTDSTSTSIRTITQGSQSTLVLQSPEHYDLTTLASSGGLSIGRGMGPSVVPMLQKVNAREMATTGVLSQSEWEGQGDSALGLIANGSTATSASVPRTSPSLVRLGRVGERRVPHHSTFKESLTDTSEEDSDGTPGGGRKSRMCLHQRQEQSPLARACAGWGEITEDERHLHPSAGASLRIGSRPGTSDSTLTTATETSGSYASFSTIPASTTSSSSTSCSESPSPRKGDKRDRMVSVLHSGDEDEDLHACALCGHWPTSPSPSLSPTREPGRPEMHPMFTVPLVTYPPPTSNIPIAMHPASTAWGRDTETDRGARYAGGRKSRRHTSVPVPAAVGVGVSPTRNDQEYNRTLGYANGGPVMTTMAKTRTLGVGMVMGDKMMKTTMPSPSPVPPPPKLVKRPRPQTAPAGVGDAAFKFFEDAKLRAREGGVDVNIGGDRSTKHRESKFKAVLRGLLRWNG